MVIALRREERHTRVQPLGAFYYKTRRLTRTFARLGTKHNYRGEKPGQVFRPDQQTVAFWAPLAPET